MEEYEVREKFGAIVEALIEKRKTVSTMESATGGMIASLITDREGASAVFKGGFVTYSNEAKIAQGVPESIIRQYTVYSEETALAMAEACRSAYDADLGVGVTGTTGNKDPMNPENSVSGEVYIALAGKDGRTIVKKIEIPDRDGRFAYKVEIAGAAAGLIEEYEDIGPRKVLFDAVLIEKPEDCGVTREDAGTIFGSLKSPEAVPVEIENDNLASSAIGMITVEAAELLGYDYGQESGFGKFVRSIIGDMANESEDGTYSFKNLRIWITR